MLPTSCLECGGELPPRAQFCLACGNPARPPQAPAAATAPEPSSTSQACIPQAAPAAQRLSGIRLVFGWIQFILWMLGCLALFFALVAAGQALGKWLPSLLR